MKILDRILGWLLVIGSLLHAWGSWMAYANQPETLLWSLSASLAGLLIAALNLLRVNRPGDRTLAWVCVAGSLAWAVVAFAFGRIIGNVLDPRALIHLLNALGLAALGLRFALK
jgi:hypothetical protein